MSIESSAISIFNPAANVETLAKNPITRTDFEQLELAIAMLTEAQKSVRTVRGMLIHQSGRGRPFKLGELLHAEALIAGYIYPLELLVGEIKFGRGAK
jgi:hypothetical protein